MIEPPPPFRLRALELADLPQVMAIEKRSFPTAKKEALYRYEIAQNHLATYHALTRTESPDWEKLLGYTGYWTLGDEVHVSTIAVDPELRRQGFGEVLLVNILFLALEQGAHLVTLEVRRSNEAAQKLYKKLQFVEVGVRRGYYHDTKEDALLMTVAFETEPQYRSFLSLRQEALYRQLALAP